MAPARPSDRPDIEAFLRSHVATSMFPLSNLARYGWDGAQPRAVRFWLRRDEVMITDVLTLTNEGIAMPQCPTGDWADVARACAGQELLGIIAEATQVAALRSALGLNDAETVLNNDEPLYQLQLSDLKVPDTPGRLVPLEHADREMMIDWRADYEVEVLNTPVGDARDAAQSDIRSCIDADSHRVLLVDNVPVSTTGFNARLSDAVQIGGVFTPPRLRGRGYARRAVALHLAEARGNGVGQAVLFAANEPAERAYRAIGFRQIGRFALCLFKEPQLARV
jgi:RimJ/RimL family protein N-acetyltransferase